MSARTREKNKKPTGVFKRLQFEEPEINQIPIASAPRVNKNLIPNRQREESMVMENLRKRVPASELERTPIDQRVSRKMAHQIASKQLKRVSSEEELANINFTLEILCWTNEYRARHDAPSLVVSKVLCDAAQKWANHLATLNEFYYRSSTSIGQNMFCCPCGELVNDLTGQEVAAYWYSTFRRYNYSKGTNLLHTSVITGHFTQMIWVKSKYFGVGKATSEAGKIIVVGFYYPCGNKVNEFHENVLPAAN